MRFTIATLLFGLVTVASTVGDSIDSCPDSCVYSLFDRLWNGAARGGLLVVGGSVWIQQITDEPAGILHARPRWLRSPLDAG